MKLNYRKSFERDLKKIVDRSVRQKIKKVILGIKQANSLSDVSNLQKLKTHKKAYRIRVNNYRIGAFPGWEHSRFGKMP